MKFKVGDNVVVKDLRFHKERWGHRNKYGDDVDSYPAGWDNNMSRYADGVTVRPISKIDKRNHYCCIDGWWWTEESLMPCDDISEKIRKILTGKSV